MHRGTLLGATLAGALAAALATHVGAREMDATSRASFDTVMALMGAMGSGDMATMDKLMADDMVWHNEGDASLP